MLWQARRGFICGRGAIDGAVVDPSFSSVKLLFGFEGSNNDTGAPGFTDLSSAAHGAGGTTGSPGIISTAAFKFGASSFKNTGSAAGHTYGAHTDFYDLVPSAADQFTYEFWFNPTQTSLSDEAFIWNFGGGQGYYFRANGDQLEFSGSGFSNMPIASSGLTWTAGQWYALAVDKDATKLRIYRDGAMVASALTVAALTPRNDTLFLGCDGSGGRQVTGYMDEFRLTKGTARYASDGGYTPAVAAFPRS